MQFSSKRLRFISRRELALIAVLVVFSVVFSVLQPAFLSASNLFVLFRQMGVVGVLSVGMCLVLISGEIDLSFVSIMVFCAYVAGNFGPMIGWPPAVLVAVAFGAGWGFINGSISVRLGVPSFLVTLATAISIEGITRTWCKNLPVPMRSDIFLDIFGGEIGPFPVIGLWLILTLIVGWFVLHRFKFGRMIYATGGGATVAELSGINTGRVKILTLVIMGFIAALASFLAVGRSGYVTPEMGAGILLTVIAAPIIGGTKLGGGVGTIRGAFLGALLMALLNNGLFIMGVPPMNQMIVRGLVILVALYFGRPRRS